MTVYLMLSAGRGPLECAWAVAELTRRLTADAGRRGVAVHREESVPGDRPGTLRSVVLRLDGPGGSAADDFAAGWTGTLCWQAPSPYRSGTSRKNWYVIARPCTLRASRTSFEESDVDIVPCRTGGPGGQRRNKVSTAVRATHRPSGLVVVVDTERHLALNRRLALQQLRDRLERDARAAADALTTARWHIHDELIRGNPVRTERP
ncbi:peptide chain release factor H [Dactylosporangium sp. CA-233914]|uniref:peptide chain release factor H n=1 Tax=Dactylosporangium sp. CA-233914 TaxID=3239934 RepID=UPI003D8F5BC5